MVNLARYVNIYHYHRRYSGVKYDFIGIAHLNRQDADEAAKAELAHEPHTKRIGLLVIRVK